MADVRYQRKRFGTLLPGDRQYTAEHYWLKEVEAGLWRVGLTTFGVRLLGDLVEYEFEVKPGAQVKTGQVIGWVEAFKATADIVAAAEGEFAGANAELERNIDAVMQDPFGAGWLYEVRGTAEEGSLEVEGYVGVLDKVIGEQGG